MEEFSFDPCPTRGKLNLARALLAESPNQWLIEALAASHVAQVASERWPQINDLQVLVVCACWLVLLLCHAAAQR